MVTMQDRESGAKDMVGRTLPGGLRILDPMGSTPEGTLYHAEYPGGPEVALLLVRAESSSAKASRRAWLERAIRIQHVNVAMMLEVGELENRSLYVVLEKVSGEPLSKLLAAGKVFPLPEALDLALQLAAGVRAAHQAGFVHGNLSPGTILMTGQAYGRPQIKVIGFELDPAVRQAAAPLPLRTDAAGYASPERLDGHVISEQGDVFSIGAILHQLLTGVPPNQGTVDRSVPRAVGAVLATALASAPARRFHSVSELHAALQRLAGAAHLRDVPGRRRALVQGAVGAAVVALLVVGVSLLPRAEVPPEGEDLVTAGLSADSISASGRPPEARPTSRTPAPAHGDSASRGNTAHSRTDPPKTPSPPVAPSRPTPLVATPSTGPAVETARDADRPTETTMVPEPPPPEPAPTLEARAQVYLRIGLDDARRHLGRPAHAIEGMSPVFYGLALSGMSPFTDSTRPVVRAVYIGPNESLLLLDQQRVRPNARIPIRDGSTWRIGNVLLRLHGEARPEFLTRLALRVR